MNFAYQEKIKNLLASCIAMGIGFLTLALPDPFTGSVPLPVIQSCLYQFILYNFAGVS